MVKYYVILSLFLIGILSSNAYAQVADQTVAGIIVPKVTSTQSKYCIDGKCATDKVITPAKFVKSTSKLPILFVSLSTTCEMMNKMGVKGCLSQDEIIKFDTSNQAISGKFIKQNGIIIRDKPQIKNHWIFYTDYTKTVICVECSYDFNAATKAKQIIIQPNTFTFINKTAVSNNHTWKSFSNRFMQGCDVSTIASIPGLLNDTISYMLSGCTKTSFNDTQIHIIPQTPFVFDNPYSSLHYKAVTDHIKTARIGDCMIHQCSQTTSTKKW